MIFIDKVKNCKIPKTLMGAAPVSCLSACEAADQGTERREATLFDLPSSRCGQHVYVQAALLIPHQQRIFLSPLNFENIALLFPVALGCLCIFSAEKLTTASWKLHLSGGGSKRTAPFLFIFTFYHPTSLQPRKPRVVS
jgi:hypothetical protein